MQSNRLDFFLRKRKKKVARVWAFRKCLSLAESHGEEVDRIVFSGVRCCLVLLRTAGVTRPTRYLCKEKKLKEPIKMCAECKTVERSPVRRDAGRGEIWFPIPANLSA